jgi:hypothetical protein
LVYKSTKSIYEELRTAMATLTEPTACQEDPDLFDPDTYLDLETKRTAAKVARGYCLECPVVNECAAFGLATRAEGMIWGGYTPDDIARMTTRNFAKNSQD